MSAMTFGKSMSCLLPGPGPEPTPTDSSRRGDCRERSELRDGAERARGAGGFTGEALRRLPTAYFGEAADAICYTSSVRSALLLLLVAACSPPWAVLRRSGPPSALAGAERIRVAVVTDGLTVEDQTLDDYLAAMDDEEEQASFRDQLATMASSFREALGDELEIPVEEVTGPPEEGEVRLTAHLVDLEPGRFAVMVAVPTELTARLQWSVGHQDVDAIETFVRISSDLTRPATIQRMRIAAAQTARLTAQFFEREQERL